MFCYKENICPAEVHLLSTARMISTEQPEKAIIVGVDTVQGGVSGENSLAELANLAESAGAQITGEITQKLKRIDPRTFVGRGKVEELRAKANDTHATVAIFDNSLSPVQARNLETEAKIRVIDRSQLILDIFARRARTLEGKLQVEVAQLTYLQPRLTRQWSHLSRLRASGGGVGTRGPGETQLEVDRRRLRERLARLRKRLRDVERTRGIQRNRRLEVPYPTAALVGYTNSGKSTLLNALTGAEVEVADRPFSTLDPTIRRLRVGEGATLMLADTVGFIDRLPHTLIEAFKATLEEVRTADLLLHVVDASSPLAVERMEIVDRVLDEIGASASPRILVFNKTDLIDHTPRLGAAHDYVCVSARTGRGLDLLSQAVARFFARMRQEVRVTLPTSRGDLVAMARRDGRVLSEEYEDGRVTVRALVTTQMAGRLRKAATIG